MPSARRAKLSTSLVYLDLPTWLQEPVIAGHLSQDLAEEVWNHCLLAPDGDSPLPERLWPVAQLLDLIAAEPHPTRH